MPASKAPEPRARSARRRRWRAVAVAALTVLASGTALAVAPGTAHALTRIPCPTDPTIRWESNSIRSEIGVRYTVLSATPAFDVVEARSIDNTLSTPISATFRSNLQKSYQVTVTLGTSADFTDKLRSNVSVAIVQSRVTTIGVDAQVQVPAYTRVIGEYGVDVYHVAYEIQRVERNYPMRTICFDRGTATGTTVAPTPSEGWRFRSG
jgi:hypothetical protein